mmetsp:Transcript_112562/g.363576  ORF Transcript_112562/g.363576 Transcript_112562/m.363576 type:complete len:366 (-) Transcript_112562:107-1204(-)
MRRCLCSLALVGVLLAALAFPYQEHLATSFNALVTLATMPSEDIDNFFKAYDVLETMGADGRVGVKSEADAKAVADLYKVLSQICAAGVLMEIMLLPPAMDKRATVLQNIFLWQARMIDHLELKPGDRVLDLGSGRGIIAANVANATGAGVIQVNLDPTQIAFGRKLAERRGLLDRMEFHVQDFNQPYPYLADGSVDAQYCAQACAFMHDKKRHLREMYRLLKPGGIVYNLEWLVKDFGERPGHRGAFQVGNATQRELVRRTGVLVAGSFPAGVLEWEEAFAEAGFELLKSHDPGEVGSLLLLDKTNKVYEPIADAIIWLSQHGLLPKRLGEMFTRFRTYWESAFEAYEQDLVSLSWEFVARKPI